MLRNSGFVGCDSCPKINDCLVDEYLSGLCGVDNCCGADTDYYNLCDMMIESAVERGRLEYYDAWQCYIREYYDS